MQLKIPDGNIRCRTGLRLRCNLPMEGKDHIGVTLDMTLSRVLRKPCDSILRSSRSTIMKLSSELHVVANMRENRDCEKPMVSYLVLAVLQRIPSSTLISDLKYSRMVTQYSFRPTRNTAQMAYLTPSTMFASIHHLPRTCKTRRSCHIAWCQGKPSLFLSSLELTK